MKVFKLLILLTAFWTSSSFAMTGNELAEYCSKKEASFSSGICSGFIRGAIDGFATALAFIGNDQRYCLPSNTTNDQTRKVVEKYLNDNPQDLHMSADILTIVAMIRAFPCKDN
jgi:hypothetical protein